MKSIRHALQARLFWVAVVILLVAGGALYAGVGRLLTDQFDEGLHDKLATFATVIEQEGDFIELGFIEDAMPEFVQEFEPDYVQLWFADHENWVLYRSLSLGEDDLPRLGGTASEPRVRDVTLRDGRAGRAIGAEFVVQNYDPGAENRQPARLALVLAKGTDALDQAMWILLVGTLVSIALILGAGAYFGGRAVGDGLKPLEALAGSIGSVDDPSQAQYYDGHGAPAELVPLIQSYNSMLARIQKAFERERRTAANIAHELRTPLAELMVLVESVQRFATEPSESAGRLAEVRELGEQMSGMIATLLELGRMESGHVPLEVEAIDLAGMVRDCWAPLSAAAEAKQQTFQALPGTGPLIQADRVALSILLGNLLRNAVDHAPEGDQIECEVQAMNGHCSFVLSNQANGMLPADIEHLPEPFWQASAAREDRSHAGIGLSLVRRLAELLQVEHSFQVEGGRFRSHLSFRSY